MPGGITCCVMSCKNNSTVAKKKGTLLKFFTFPRDRNLRNKWVKRCHRSTDWEPGRSRVCSKHFQIDDFEDKIKARLLNKHPKRLKNYAIPSLLLPHNADDLTAEESSKLDRSEVKENEPSEIAVKIKDEDDNWEEEEQKDFTVNSTTDVEQETVLESLIPPESGHTIDTSISLSDKIKRCRLCLETLDSVFPFQSVITFDDGSTLDVYQTFQKITKETDEQMQNEEYPANLCMNCLKLLVGANNFYEKYQESLTIIQKILRKESKVCQLNEGDNSDITTQIDESITENNENSEAEISASDDVNHTIRHMCPICPKLFTAVELKKHCWEHGTLKSYLIGAPKFKKKVKKYFDRPKPRVSLFNVENPSLTCPFCPEQLATDSYFKHIVEHDRERNFKCQTCYRKFMSKSRLRMHQFSHQGEAPYQCPEPRCRKRFFQKRNFLRHITKHASSDSSDVFPFKCSACSKAFTHQRSLKEHILTHESSENIEEQQNIFFCSTCQRKFDTGEEFRRHMCSYKKRLLSKNIEKSLVLCYICGKRVFNIYQHMQAHTGRAHKKERSLMCSQCGKLFSHMSNFYRHVKTVHEKDNSSYCKYCSKGFRDSHNLKMHERTHERLHEGTQPVRQFVCDLCDQRFTERGYLIRHQKKYHPESLMEFESTDKVGGKKIIV